jgi:hypothetical protein
VRRSTELPLGTRRIGRYGVMRETDRPPAERVSVLDRAPNVADRSAVESSLLLAGLSMERVRLACEVDDSQVLVGRDEDDGLCLAIQKPSGSGAAGVGTRSVLREAGAVVLVCSDGRRVFVGGIVADEVTAVRVGDVPAYVRDNAFLAEIGREDSRAPVDRSRGTGLEHSARPQVSAFKLGAHLWTLVCGSQNAPEQAFGAT